MQHEFERTIARNGDHEIVIKKSRFICTMTRVASEGDAREIIELTRKKSWDANHHCTAWRMGKGGRLQRSNDDGEPSGTAGVPMLEVLVKRDLTDVLAIVTRFFGGTKLGAGGLIRAYGGAVSATVDVLGIVERRPLHMVDVAIPHADSGRVENALRFSGYDLAGVTYNASDVSFRVHLGPDQLDRYRAYIAELTNGRAIAHDDGVMFVEVAL